MSNTDLDFIGFTLGRQHSLRDLKIYRTSDGNRYNINLTPPIKDTTAEVTGGDGQYLFDTKYSQRQFSIPFAFDRMTEEEVNNLRKALNGKEVKELIFDELPYKAYSVKVSGTPQIKVIPFTEIGEDGSVERVYRGEGTVQFTCYYPFAHTPTWRWFSGNGVDYSVDEGTADEPFDGRIASDYTKGDNFAYPTFDEWGSTTQLAPDHNVNVNKNRGDVPAPFLAKISYMYPVVEINGQKISLKKRLENSECDGYYYWESRLGLIYYIKKDPTTGKETKTAVLYEGNACATIPVGAEVAAKVWWPENNNQEYPLDLNNIKFQYWYL